jgi:hypothetical protein
VSTVSLCVAQRASVYEEALDAALEIMADSWETNSADQALIEELRNAFRVAETTKAAA